MKLLLDQGLPRSTVALLLSAGIECSHVGDLGMAGASDQAILQFSREHAFILVTLNSDFHSHLALARDAGPSVIRIRIEGLRAPDLAGLLIRVLDLCAEDISRGAMVSVTEAGVRIRHLPLVD